jgi:hypothetical protein
MMTFNFITISFFLEAMNYEVFLIFLAFQLVQINASIERVDGGLEKALIENGIQLKVKDKQKLLNQIKMTINLRREMALKYKLEMTRKYEKLQKERIEREKSIFKKYLLGRIKSSILKDFHTLRY